MNRSFISELEELVLLSVAVLSPNAYAYGIRLEIKDQVPWFGKIPISSEVYQGYKTNISVFAGHTPLGQFDLRIAYLGCKAEG